jgi:hypothetical protein
MGDCANELCDLFIMLLNFFRATVETIVPLSWQLLVLWLVWTFRDGIRERLANLDKVDTPVGSAGFRKPEQTVSNQEVPKDTTSIAPDPNNSPEAAPPIAADEAAQTKPTTTTRVPADNLDDENATPTIRHHRVILDQTLEKLGINGSEKRMKWFRATAAVFWIRAKFEEIDREIYGTQMNLLMALQGAPQGLTREEIEPFFQAHIEWLKKEGMSNTFDNWMLFLIARGLVFKDGDKYKIGELAVEFGHWLWSTRKVRPRPR